MIWGYPNFWKHPYIHIHDKIYIIYHGSGIQEHQLEIHVYRSPPVPWRDFYQSISFHLPVPYTHQAVLPKSKLSNKKTYFILAKPFRSSSDSTYFSTTYHIVSMYLTTHIYIYIHNTYVHIYIYKYIYICSPPPKIYLFDVWHELIHEINPLLSCLKWIHTWTPYKWHPRTIRINHIHSQIQIKPFRIFRE